jgi:hypothetical protein
MSMPLPGFSDNSKDEAVAEFYRNDLKKALDWWRRAKPSDRILVWEEIQRDVDTSETNIMEIVLLFAQLGFEHVVVKSAEITKNG